MTTKGVEDPRLAKALSRYEIVARYLTAKPKRGQKKKLLDELAAETWVAEDGSLFKVEAETIRAWARRYRRGGLQGLMDKERPRRGTRVLTEEQCALVCRLKEEVPERSLERIIKIAEDMALVEPDVLKRSTVHRVLQAKGISQRALRTPDKDDLDRFEAAQPNDIWQSDMLEGPWLPDPQRPGKVRRAHLYAFLDDHSRLILHGRFSFKESLPHLELVFRRALNKWGLPVKCYFDNGAVYRSQHVKQIVAEIGSRAIIFTQVGRPMGHGKIEALNRQIRSAFIAEVKVSKIKTLDELNEAFVAWADYEYNRKTHTETGQTPLDRWRAGVERVTYVEEEKMRQAFLWRETRTPDKAGVFSLLGIRYQVGPGHGRRKLEARFDPEALNEVEVWRQGEFLERVRPLEITPHRRPKPSSEKPAGHTEGEGEPAADWLSHLVEKRRKEGFIDPLPKQLAADAKAGREQKDLAVLKLLEDRLDEGVADTAAVRDYLNRFGPFDPDLAEKSLEALLDQGEGRDQHVSFYLDAIRTAEKGQHR
jgi:putative transposase